MTLAILKMAGIALAALIALVLLFKVFRQIRGRDPAERASLNFAQSAKDKRNAPRKLARRAFYRTCLYKTWQTFRWLCLGMPARAGRRTGRVWLGESMKPTRVSTWRSPSSRVPKAKRTGRFVKKM